jgi:nucleoside-diphosphate-sugar epimerase
VTRRVAVTGSTGFIGRHLVASLAARGDEVRAIHRSKLFDTGELTGLFRGCDAVVHLAGVVSTVDDREYAAVNVEATRAVAAAARAAGARLIHISSLAAAGPAPVSAPRTEDDPPRPITEYGRSKLESERVVRAVDGLRWTILRPGVVYGPGDRALLPLFRYVRRGVLPLIGRSTTAYMFIHISDAVRAIEAAIDRDAHGETLFVGHPHPVTVRELLEGVRAAAGRRAAIVRIPPPLGRLAAAFGDVVGAIRGRPLPLNGRRWAEMNSEGFVCRVDRLRDRLGVVAQVDLREGLTRTANWYRQQGWL